MIEIPSLLKDLLADSSITDICLNGHGCLRVARGNGFEETGPSPFDGKEEEYRQFVLEQLSLSGKTWDAKLPFVDTVFFNTHRAHLVFPPISRSGICLSLRRLPLKTGQDRAATLNAIEARWSKTPSAFGLLREAVSQHESILFCGATGSGKTTLFNDLLAFIPAEERLVALEDTAEINPSHPHFLSLLSRPPNADGFGGVTLRDLVRQTLRMKPDRILIGECRGDEVLDLLLALNTGHRGTLATLHANSALDGLKRLELLALIASKGQIPSNLVRSLIAKGFDKIVHLQNGASGRQISEIIALEGMERETIVSRKVFPMTQAPSFGESHPSLPPEAGRMFPRG